MSIRRAQVEIDSAEFAQWEAFDRVEPFGEDRADLRSAIVACVIANANRDTEKQPQPFKVSDFMPSFDRPKKETPEQTWNKFAAMTPVMQKAKGKR